MCRKTSGQKLVGSSIQTSTSNRRSTTPTTSGGKSRIGTVGTPSGCAVRSDTRSVLDSRSSMVCHPKLSLLATAISGFAAAVSVSAGGAVHWSRRLQRCSQLCRHQRRKGRPRQRQTKEAGRRTERMKNIVQFFLTHSGPMKLFRKSWLFEPVGFFLILPFNLTVKPVTPTYVAVTLL